MLGKHLLNQSLPGRGLQQLAPLFLSAKVCSRLICTGDRAPDCTCCGGTEHVLSSARDPLNVTPRGRASEKSQDPAFPHPWACPPSRAEAPGGCWRGRGRRRAPQGVPRPPGPAPAPAPPGPAGSRQVYEQSASGALCCGTFELAGLPPLHTAWLRLVA